MNKPVLTVGLLWHSFSSDNLGVGALSESQIAICEAAAAQAGVEVRFIVFGTAGARNYIPCRSTIEIGAAISLKDMLTGRSKFLEDLTRCELVLDIGEGDSFAAVVTDIAENGARIQLANMPIVARVRANGVLPGATITVKLIAADLAQRRLEFMRIS